MKPAYNWDDADAAVEIAAGRSDYWLFTLYKPNGKAAALDGGAVVRFKLALTDEDDPLLDIDNLGGLTGGSIVIIVTRGTDEVTPAQVKVCFAQDDTADLDAGDYFGELGVVDTAEANPANAFKRAAYGTVTVKSSPGGDVGLT